MEIKNHHRGQVVAATVFCLLSCVTDVAGYHDEGQLRASHYKELHGNSSPGRSSPESTSRPGSSAPILHHSTMTPHESGRVHRSMAGLSPSLKAAPRGLAPAPSPVPGDEYAPAPAPGGRRRRSKSVRWGVGFALGTASGAFVAVLSAVVLHYILTFRRRAGSRPPKRPVIFNKDITVGMLEFLTKDVGEGLREESLVGEGGSGKVYRVVLSNALVVAVKHVPRVNPRGPDQETPAPTDGTVPAPRIHCDIRGELDMLGFIRHRNLVQLWAYIYRRDSHLLIYEFMERGSLRDVFRQMKTGELSLSWPQRHRIMCGVAHGIAYLHNSHGSCIVHRDLKPGNILITDDFEAKLADFGLAAILPDQATHRSTEHLAGTIGYIAPEYHQTLRYSQKADIYSFGVVLAQMVTAREPTEDMFIEDGGSIGMWLQRSLNAGDEQQVEMIIDPALRQGADADECVGEMVLAMKVAVFCMSLDPQLRPSSVDLVTMLLQIRAEEPVNAAVGTGPLTGLSLHSGAVGSEPFSDRINEEAS